VQPPIREGKAFYTTTKFKHPIAESVLEVEPSLEWYSIHTGTAVCIVEELPIGNDKVPPRRGRTLCHRATTGL